MANGTDGSLVPSLFVELSIIVAHLGQLSNSHNAGTPEFEVSLVAAGHGGCSRWPRGGGCGAGSLAGKGPLACLRQAEISQPRSRACPPSPTVLARSGLSARLRLPVLAARQSHVAPEPGHPRELIAVWW